MAVIYLVRHGQASWDKDDYDQLSSLGYHQSEILGQHWHNFPAADICYSGGLLRHQQTAEHFFKGLQQPCSIIEHHGFSEFDHINVLQCYQSQWHKQGDFYRYLQQQDDPERAFIIEFSNAMTRWVSGDYDDYKESFVDFKNRCMQALQDVISAAKQQKLKNIMIFTSGGVIASICGGILALDDNNIMKLNKQLVNTSISKILFNKEQVTLDSINNYSHLSLMDNDFVTRR